MLSNPEERRQCQRWLRMHHYLGGLKAVDSQGRWMALLLFNVAAKHLKHRDQRVRRLSLVVDNSRFLILPQAHIPNLGQHACCAWPRTG